MTSDLNTKCIQAWCPLYSVLAGILATEQIISISYSSQKSRYFSFTVLQYQDFIEMNNNHFYPDFGLSVITGLWDMGMLHSHKELWEMGHLIH